ncbi:MAG: Ig-like domain-containing protein [Silvibacterium sp.]
MNPGDAITLSVLASSQKGRHPRGSVTFWDGKRILTTSVINELGRSTVSVPLFGAGRHVIRATYPGNDNYRPATTASMPINVYSLAAWLLGGDASADVPLESLEPDKGGSEREQFELPGCDNAVLNLGCFVSRKPSGCSATEGTPEFTIKW